MSKNSDDTIFTAQHHALLFSCIVKAIFINTGKKNREILIRKAIRKYGEQRGKRMALRAEKNGHNLDVVSYFAYGEWVVPKNELDLKLIEKKPDARLNIFKCPWHSVWKEKNLLEYGKYFCKEIDAALVFGFNPDLEIIVNSTQTNGDKLCDFIFKDAQITFLKTIDLLYKKKITPGADAIMPWEYHAGHLFKTFGEVIKQDLGVLADKIIEDALVDFIDFSSTDHIKIIKKYENTDFDKLP